jgi:extracellular elastinolytic metalloproteinase
MHKKPDNPPTVHNALLQFMIAATPKVSVVQDILAKYEHYLEGMWSEYTHHLVGTHGVPAHMIHNVPDTIGPVKARLAYVQVPHENGTALNLVWKASNLHIIMYSID